MALRIRQMRKRDLLRLSEIYAVAYRKANIGENWTPKTARKLLSYWLELQPDLAFVAELNGHIAGAFVAGIKPWWDGNHIWDGELFVHPDCQKRGIATKLSIALYKKALKKYKVTVVDVYTFKKRKFPLRWYLSQGFAPNEEWVMISGNVKRVLSRLQG